MPPSAREFAEFNALLHSVVEKGLPLPPAIHLMAGVVRDPSLREALGGVARDLGDGASLADALGRFPDVFPPDYCARVRAGAEGGRLAEILRAAQIEHEFRARARSRMTRLLIYLLAGAIMGEIVIGLTLLMGRQVNLFNALILDQMQIVSKHPLLELLDAALDSGWILLGAWPGLILLALLAHRLLERSARAGGLGYLIPVWGRIRKSRDLAAFCSTLGLRLRSGLAMVPALRAAREAVRTRKFHAMTDRLIHRVEEGESLSSALFYLNFFPRTLAWGVSLAEENGEVPKTFDAFADLYTREMDRHFTILQELLTPLGMLVIGNVALLSALMVLAPFFQIITIQTSLSSSSSGGMEDSLKIAIGLTTLNLLFLAFLQVSYLLVSRRRLKISLLVEHLATLARHGMPIQAGLRVVGRDLGGYMGSRVARLAQGLEEGKTLGQAFDGAPRMFPPLLRSMLTLGDRSGNLAGFLESMRKSYRRIADRPHQSLYLFLYPLLLSMGLNLALAGLYAEIIPKFRTILDQLRLDPTQQEVWWPRVMAANEGILVLTVALVVFFVMGGTSIHFGTPLLRRMKGAVDRVLLALPLVGGLLRDGAVQQFALCSGLFLRSGAALPEALRSAAAVERNGILRGRLDRIGRAVGEGARLSASVRGDGLGGEDLLWFLETGESSGLLSDHLLLAAQHYESKVRILSRLAARAVVPFFILLNGLIVFATFFLIFAPIRGTIESMLQRRPF